MRAYQQPIVHDLYCGLGGWAEGFLSECYRVIGYDIEKHDYGTGTYPGTLILCDVRSIHGSQLADAACIVASPPCQEPAFRAQPWKTARALKPDVLPVWWNKVERSTTNLKNKKVEVMSVKEMEEWEQYQAFYPLPPPTLFIELFNACFRIQREASEAAGHYIPMIVENVRGAEKWVGPARWHFGSFYLWGDVPALMPPTFRLKQPGRNFHFPEKYGIPSPSWHRAEHEPSVQAGIKMGWDNSERGKLRRADGVKSPGTKLSEVGFNVRNAQRFREEHQKGIPHAPTGHWTNPRENGTKQPGIGGARKNGKGDAWFQDGAARHGSKSDSRKAASAEIAKIPFPLAQWIAKCFDTCIPDRSEVRGG